MLDLMLMDEVQARPPPENELANAWRLFFEHKLKRNEAVNNLQARHVLRTFKHLQKTNLGEEGIVLNMGDLRRARKVLSVLPMDNRDAHNELARLIYAECLKSNDPNSNERRADFKHFIRVLTETGDAMEARRLVQEASEKDGEDGPSISAGAANRNLWPLVLAGLARENNEAELLKTIDMAEAAGMLYNADMHRIMSGFYASRDDVKGTKQWYSKPLATRSGAKTLPLPDTTKAILRFCIRNNELGWCKAVFRDILASNPRKRHWDVILQWAAGALGKGVEDVERMMEVMVRRNEDDDSLRPDIETINGLVDIAMSSKDPYLAERYIALGIKHGIHPNSQTYILQMNYRADAGDLTGAQVAYDALQSEEILDDEDLPAINNYIRALCAAKSLNYDRIISITSDLEERHKRLEAPTAAALCMMHLKRNEVDEIEDMLQTHAYHYTIDERASIINNFLSFILDRNNNTVRAWEAYTLMRSLFDETSTAIRTRCMNEFFARKRCDMASHVFGHMRQHTIHSRRPVIETYIQCFLGIAECEDREALDMVHNMLKMDSSIEPNTKLYNSLMLAYTACEDADRALNFWDDITNSTEGPSYRSLEIVFWACGRKPFGDRLAREIWRKIKAMEIEVTRDVFVAYVGALAGQGKFEEARDLVEGMEKDVGLKVDVVT